MFILIIKLLWYSAHLIQLATISIETVNLLITAGIRIFTSITELNYIP